MKFNHVMGVVGVALACSVPALAVDIIDGPTLTMDPNGFTPLAGVVELETAAPSLASLQISGDGDSWTVVFPEASLVHYLPVLGMKSDRTYTVEVLLTDGSSPAAPADLAGVMMAVTPPLPDDFPTMLVEVSDPIAMEPGYTVLDCLRRAPGDTRETYSVIVDNSGDVVWYTTQCHVDLTQLQNGNLATFSAPTGGDPVALEYDMLGTEVLRVQLDDPGSRLHHDMIRTPMGTYVSLSHFEVEIADFPTSDVNPHKPTALTLVRDEPVVEFLPDGTLRDWWLLTEIIDPTRIGYGSLNSSPEGVDWAHTNAVTYDPSDDSFIVSARHQDAVFKFSRTTGELVWILGPHDNWPAEFDPYLLVPIGSPFRWQFHQHAPMITGEGTLLLYDNGNFRASPFDGQRSLADSENFSRAVEYEINENTMSVRQVWEFGEHIAETLYTGLIGDADWQPTNGNVLLTFGAVSYTGGVAGADIDRGEWYARIVEVTDDEVPVTVFDLSLYDDSDPAARIRVYRSERIPSLYPSTYIRAPNGVGDSLIAGKVQGETLFSWAASPVDGAHDAAAYYIVYQSNSPDGGFEMMDTSQGTSSGPVVNAIYYRIVAANGAGTSGDEPVP